MIRVVVYLLLLFFLVEAFLVFLAERVLALVAEAAAFAVLPVTLLAALAVLVVILLAASASFLMSRLFSRAPFLIVFCTDCVVVVFLPRPRLPGTTALTMGAAIFDIVSTAVPATLDA